VNQCVIVIVDPTSTLDPAATAIESDWTDGLAVPSRKLSALCECLFHV